jgi:hypothetical protein
MFRKLTIRQVELTRTLRAAKNAGHSVVRVEVDYANGKAVMIFEAAEVTLPNDALDKWMAGRARTS